MNFYNKINKLITFQFANKLNKMTAYKTLSDCRVELIHELNNEKNKQNPNIGLIQDLEVFIFQIEELLDDIISKHHEHLTYLKD